MLNCRIDGKNYAPGEADAASLENIVGKMHGAEIENSDTPVEQARQLLTQGGMHLAGMLVTIGKTVVLYRSGDLTMGGQAFVELITGLELFAGLTTITSSALRVDFMAACFGRHSLEERVTDLNRILMEIVSCQERRDWVFLADLLAYELAPQLERWQEIYALLHQHDN